MRPDSTWIIQMKAQFGSTKNSDITHRGTEPIRQTQIVQTRVDGETRGPSVEGVMPLPGKGSRRCSYLQTRVDTWFTASISWFTKSSSILFYPPQLAERHWIWHNGQKQLGQVVEANRQERHLLSPMSLLFPTHCFDSFQWNSRSPSRCEVHRHWLCHLHRWC